MNATPHRSVLPLALPRRRYEFAAIAGIIFAPALYCTTLIYPTAAIADLLLLEADDFRAKYAGINISTLEPADEGWYVRYRHENLTYLFGPLPDRAAARQALWEMQDVRDAALKNRPSLGSSQVDYVRFTYSNVYGKAGDTPYLGGKSADGDKDGIGAHGSDGAGGGNDGGADSRGGRDATGKNEGNGLRAGLAGDANGGAEAGGRGSRGQAGGQTGGSGTAQPAGNNSTSISGTSAGGGGQGQQSSATGSHQPAAGGMPGTSGQSGGGANPLQLLGLLLRKIMGV